MTLNVCPAAVVAAPMEVVWDLLMQPSRYGEWWDIQDVRIVPEGPVAAGQVIYGSSKELGIRFNFSFAIEIVDPVKHRVQLRAKFPLGIGVHNRIACTPIDAVSCRVQYG